MSDLERLEPGLDAAPGIVLAQDSLAGEPDVWLVGGAVRDVLLGRPVLDVDLAVGGSPEAAARRVAEAGRGTAFPLSEEFGAWRVVGPAQTWRIDISALRGSGIEEDLGARDFTINAIGIPLGGDPVPVDPTGGMGDLEARVLRAAGPDAFESDPVRVLRAARIAAELGFDIEAATLEMAGRASPRSSEPSGERQFLELRLAIAGADPLRALELLDLVGATTHLLPEVEALRGVEQNPYHHLDVLDHSRAVLAEWLRVERDPGLVVDSVDEVASYLDQPLGDELSRGEALRFAALLHDVGKPATRTVNEEGRVLFLGHDRVGEEIVRSLCARLRTSRKLSHTLELLTRHHLRLGFLVHEAPLERDAVYRYLAETSPVSLDVTLLSIADRLATRGEKTRQEAIDAHLELARGMVEECVGWLDAPPQPPVRGDELAIELGIEIGPEIGELLESLREAAFTGLARGRDDAIDLARRLLGGKKEEPDG